jgi:hypothetical protein
MRWLSCLGLEFMDAGAAASEGGRPRGCLIGGNVAVVMALFFGHLGGEEQAAGDLGGVDASAMTSRRLCFEGRARGQREVRL